MPDALALTIALLVLAGTLAAAVSETRWASEATIAAAGAALLVALGALSPSQAWNAVSDLAPTAAFLAALLVLADACRRAGLFDALGTWLAVGSQGSPSRLLALVFAVAAVVTAVLSLDATVLLLTPVVLATALRLRTSPRPHVYASAHLANSASLLLPVSNLTNLLAFHASGLSFTRFAALMAAPWAGAIAVEWAVLRRTFRVELRRGAPSGGAPFAAPRSSVCADARRLLPELARRDRAAVGRGRGRPRARGAGPGDAGGRRARGIAGVRRVRPRARRHRGGGGRERPRRRGRGAAAIGPCAARAAAHRRVAAILANLVNNLPATLVLVPVAAAAGGEGAVLAVLVGVNVGPNLTYTGSLATLLWRRVLRAEDEGTSLREFVRLGLLTVPAGVVVAVVLLWLALQVGG